MKSAFEDLTHLHHSRGYPTGALQPGTQDPAAHLFLRLLIYARRTFEVALHLRSKLPSHSAITELGAGFAPALLALGTRSTRLTFTESQSGYAPLRRVLFEEILPLPSPAQLPETPRSGHLLIYAFSLDELSERNPSRAQSMVHTHLASGFDVLIIEPGDQHHARRLQALRDHLWPLGYRPTFPCEPSTEACPKLQRNDWCHFTYKAAPAPTTERLLSSLGRDPHYLHFSTLYYRPTWPVRRPTQFTGTVLHRVALGRSKTALETCSNRGLQRLVALNRHKALAENLNACRPLDRIEIDPEPHTKGDGLRLAASAEIRHCEFLSEEASPEEGHK